MVDHGGRPMGRPRSDQDQHSARVRQALAPLHPPADPGGGGPQMASLTVSLAGSRVPPRAGYRVGRGGRDERIKGKGAHPGSEDG